MKVGSLLAGLAGAQLLFGFLIQITVIRTAGLGLFTDAFIAAQSVPLVFFAVISVSLQSSWLPKLSVLKSSFLTWRKANGVAIGQTLILSGGVALLISVLFPIWAPALFSKFNEQQLHLMLGMSNFLAAAMVLNCLSVMCLTALRSRDSFISGEVTHLLGSVLALSAVYFLVPMFGIEAAAWVLSARALIVFATLYFLCFRPRFSVVRAISDRESWKNIGMLFSASSLYKTSPIVDRYWSAQSFAGATTIYSFAQTAMGALATVIERSVCMPVLPQLSRLVEQKRFRQLRSKYRATVGVVSIVVIVLTAALIVFSSLLEIVLSELLSVDSSATKMITELAFALLVYMHIAASGNVVMHTFYAMNDTRTPVNVGVIGFFISLGIRAVGFIEFGLLGLAYCMSLYYFLNMLTAVYLLERELEKRISENS